LSIASATAMAQNLIPTNNKIVAESVIAWTITIVPLQIGIAAHLSKIPLILIRLLESSPVLSVSANTTNAINRQILWMWSLGKLNKTKLFN